MAVINSYSELTSTAKVVYSRYKSGTASDDDVTKLLMAGMINEQEVLFIKG